MVEISKLDISPPLPPSPQKNYESSDSDLIKDRDRAIDTAIRMIEDALDGQKHNELLKASRLLGGYVAGGYLSYDEAYSLLCKAIEAKPNIQNLNDAYKTIKDGLKEGIAHPILPEQREAERKEFLDGKSNGIFPKEQPSNAFEIKHPLEGYNLSQQGIAEYWRDRNNADWQYSVAKVGSSKSESGQWYKWDGAHWEKAITYAPDIDNLLKELNDKGLIFLKQATSIVASYEGKEKTKKAELKASENKYKRIVNKTEPSEIIIRQVRKRTEAISEIHASKFDQDTKYINMRNGVLDLETRTLHSHNKNISLQR